MAMIQITPRFEGIRHIWQYMTTAGPVGLLAFHC